MPIVVIKSSKEEDLFDVNKLKHSLQRSGASKETVDEIIETISSKLFDGITTKAIYKLAFSLLRKNAPSTAARYKLKKAIMELGPTGFPFEQFIGQIFKHQGYQVEVGIIAQGHCVQHELDVVAKKDHQQFMIECKYHSSISRNCDIKVPLYIQSRFKDMEFQWQKLDPKTQYIGGVYTNTRFSSDAIKYGECMGLLLVGWDYPKNNGLKHQIDRLGLHPVTCLTTLSKSEKQGLLNQGVVLATQILEQSTIMNKIGIKSERQQKILSEVQALCVEK